MSTYYNTGLDATSPSRSYDFKTFRETVPLSYAQVGSLGQSGLLTKEVDRIVHWSVTNTAETGGPILYQAQLLGHGSSSTSNNKLIVNIYVKPLETVVIAKECQPFYIMLGSLYHKSSVTGNLRSTFSYQEFEL